MKPSFGDA